MKCESYTHECDLSGEWPQQPPTVTTTAEHPVQGLCDKGKFHLCTGTPIHTTVVCLFVLSSKTPNHKETIANGFLLLMVKS